MICTSISRHLQHVSESFRVERSPLAVDEVVDAEAPCRGGGALP